MPAIHDAHATMFGLARHGELYERWAGRLAGRLYARVTSDLLGAALPPGARILDAGTGPGLLPLRIAAACPQLTVDAVDLSPQMIDRARQSAASAGQAAAVPFPVADGAALPFPDATFDLVVSTISQHHWTDPGAGVGPVVLADGGYDEVERGVRKGQGGAVGDGEGDRCGLPGGSGALPGSVDHLRGEVDGIDRQLRTGGGDTQREEPGPGPGIEDPSTRGERGAEQVGRHPGVQAPGETAGPAFIQLAVTGEAEHGGVRVMDRWHQVLLVQL